MKKVFFAALMLASVSLVSTQSNASFKSYAFMKEGSSHEGGDDNGNHGSIAVPSAVMASFNSNFPTATRVEFEKEREHGSLTYKAKFFIGNQRWIAVFSPDGTLLSSGKK